VVDKFNSEIYMFIVGQSDGMVSGGYYPPDNANKRSNNISELLFYVAISDNLLCFCSISAFQI
jgi:hypothetical protein